MQCYYLTKDHTSQRTPVEEKIATYVMKRKFSLSKDKITKLRTGGRPLHVVKATKAISSLDASVRVTQKRTNEIEHFFETDCQQDHRGKRGSANAWTEETHHRQKSIFVKHLE